MPRSGAPRKRESAAPLAGSRYNVSEPMIALLLQLLAAPALGGARPASPLYEANCQGPVWSPDGAKLAWEVNDHEARSITLYIYSPGQGAPRKVLPPRAGGGSLTAGFSTSAGAGVAHELSWAPSAPGRFVYSASTGGVDYDLYLDSGSPVAPGPGVDGGAAWSPDGRWIAFTSGRTGQGDLYLLDASNLSAPPRLLAGSPDTAELYAAWSPDSRALAFVSHTSRGDQILIVSDLAKPAARALTSWSHTQTRPRFSPDGRFVAFYSNHLESARFDLWVAPVAGGEPRLVTTSVVLNARGPSWTPDGRLVYVSDDDNRLDPVMIATLGENVALKTLATGTLGNGDLDVVRGTDGKTWLAIAAQGREGDLTRTFRRVYVMELP